MATMYTKITNMPVEDDKEAPTPGAASSIEDAEGCRRPNTILLGQNQPLCMTLTR